MEACWERAIVVTSAANSVPVADYGSYLGRFGQVTRALGRDI